MSGPYGELLGEFGHYFEAEMDAVGDDALRQELGIIDMLVGRAAD